jgi:hypothetical protein
MKMYPELQVKWLELQFQFYRRDNNCDKLCRQEVFPFHVRTNLPPHSDKGGL